jgi:ELWxxDGT repeat protein
MKNKILPVLLALMCAGMQSDAQVVVGITEKVADINMGLSKGSHPRYLTNYNNTIFFSADNATNNQELWKTGGTTATTSLVKDLNPGPAGSSPRGFKVMNGSLYFVATNGTEILLWTTDGTPVNTQQVSSVDILYNIFSNNSLLLFAGKSANGYELWTSDGSSGGTQELVDINTGSEDSYPSCFTLLGTKVLFGAHNGTTYSPYITDGTALGTELLAPINIVGTTSAAFEYTGKEETYICEYNGEAYFAAEDASHGYELWKTDGTPTGTVIVKDIAPGVDPSLPNSFKVYNGKLYFSVNKGNPAIDGLWISSGTAANTVRLKSGISMGDGDVIEYAEMNGNLYFIASGNVWVTDGTISGTHAVVNSPLNPHRLSILNNKLYCFGTSTTVPAMFALFQLDDAGNVIPVSMPMANATLPDIHTDTMGNCIYFAAAPETNPADIELYRFKDTTFSVGVNNIEAAATSDIYPNPATNSFSVKNVTGKNTSVYIYSLTGQLLLTAAKTENIEIAQLPAGIYTVQIISDGVVTVGKLRKE